MDRNLLFLPPSLETMGRKTKAALSALKNLRACIKKPTKRLRTGDTENVSGKKLIRRRGELTRISEV